MLKHIDKMGLSNFIKQLNILLGRKPRYLFIFSHMRSRSSVLSHVLGTNPGICGYSELHLHYKDQQSVDKLHELLFEELKCDFTNKYLLDKILSNNIFSDEVLNITKPKVVFLLREPESTIKSIINMGYITGIEWYKDPEKAAAYYCERLDRMEKLSKKAVGGYLFIESDDLVDNTGPSLERITKWLNLKKPLSKEYDCFNNTGKPSFGDPSERIKSGVLERTEGYPNIDIPLDVLKKCKRAYEDCKRALVNNKPV